MSLYLVSLSREEARRHVLREIKRHFPTWGHHSVKLEVFRKGCFRAPLLLTSQRCLLLEEIRVLGVACKMADLSVPSLSEDRGNKMYPERGTSQKGQRAYCADLASKLPVDPRSTLQPARPASESFITQTYH